MVMTSLQQNQVNEQRQRSHKTLRATVPALEKILYTPIARLDYGFVRVVDYMGDDEAVVQAARVSYGRGTQSRSSDRTLIRYLMRHHHTTPFEMCEIKLHVKLPIFVARQWVRHRTANINEYSARYSILDREFYIPDPEVIASQSETNRQGRGELVPAEHATWVQQLLIEDATRAYDHYEELLNIDSNGSPLDPQPRRPGPGAGPHQPVAQLLHPVVLEGGPAQPPELPASACRSPRAVRDPRLRGDDTRRDREALGPVVSRGVPGLPAQRPHALKPSNADGAKTGQHATHGSRKDAARIRNRPARMG